MVGRIFKCGHWAVAMRGRRKYGCQPLKGWHLQAGGALQNEASNKKKRPFPSFQPSLHRNIIVY